MVLDVLEEIENERLMSFVFMVLALLWGKEDHAPTPVMSQRVLAA